MTLPPDFVVDPPPVTGRIAFEHDWRDLAFLHWRIPVAAAAPYMPPGTRPDTFEGDTFVALVPFEIRTAGMLGSPAVPYFGDFLETNVRLYSVDDAGRHGVVFRSLESSRLLISLIARTGVGLPYTWSRQRCEVQGLRRTWTTRRRWPAHGLRTRISVDVGPVIERPDDLAVFLTARWGLHTERFGRTVWMPNYHPQWVLQSAERAGVARRTGRCRGDPGDRPPRRAHHVLAGVHTVFGEPVAI